MSSIDPKLIPRVASLGITEYQRMRFLPFKYNYSMQANNVASVVYQRNDKVYSLVIQGIIDAGKYTFLDINGNLLTSKWGYDNLVKDLTNLVIDYSHG